MPGTPLMRHLLSRCHAVYFCRPMRCRHGYQHQFNTSVTTPLACRLPRDVFATSLVTLLVYIAAISSRLPDVRVIDYASLFTPFD